MVRLPDMIRKQNGQTIRYGRMPEPKKATLQQELEMDVYDPRILGMFLKIGLMVSKKIFNKHMHLMSWIKEKRK